MCGHPQVTCPPETRSTRLQPLRWFNQLTDLHEPNGPDLLDMIIIAHR